MPALLLLTGQPALQTADQRALHEAGCDAGIVIDQRAQQDATLERPHAAVAVLVVEADGASDVDLDPVLAQLVFVLARQLVVLRAAGANHDLAFIIKLLGLLQNRQAADPQTRGKHRHRAGLGDILIHDDPSPPFAWARARTHPNAAELADHPRPCRHSLMAARWQTRAARCGSGPTRARQAQPPGSARGKRPCSPRTWRRRNRRRWARRGRPNAPLETPRQWRGRRCGFPARRSRGPPRDRAHTDRQILGAHGGDDLVGFGLLDTRIVGALADEQWFGYSSRGVKRRALPQQRTPRLCARI